MPDHRHRDTVIAFYTDRLGDDPLDPRITRQLVVECLDALDHGIFRVRIEDASITHDVIRDDQPAGARELDRPVQVAGIVLLVGVDEDHVEW